MRNYVVAIVGTVVLQLSACSDGGGGGGTPPPPSADLSNLVLSAGPLVPAFTSATTGYTLAVGFNTDTTTVTPTAVDPGATIRVEGTIVASGSTSAALALVVGDTTLGTQVTAANGTIKTYQVVVTRAVASSNADLTDLGISVADLDQAFQPTLLDYTAGTGFLGSVTQVVAVSADAFSTIDVEGTIVDSGEPSPPLALAAGTTTAIEVRVTAEDGITQQSYNIEVSRAAAAAFAQRAYAKASNTDQDDVFGNALALAGDTLVTGAPGEASSATGVDGNESDNSLVNAGAAYVFVRDGSGVWTQQAYLKASNTDSGDLFGSAVAISGDTVAIGAPGEASLDGGNQSDNSGSNVGAVYVFVRSGTTWTQQAYLKASNPDTDDLFSDVTLEDDALVVGARGEGSGATGIDGDPTDDSAPGAGAAYVFVRDAGGTWSQTTYIKASNAEEGDAFGRVSLSGASLAVGAVGENGDSNGVGGSQSDNSQVDAGATYLFVQDVAGNWAQQAYIKASNTDAGDGFGRVALEGDLLVVGAPGENSNATGIGGDQDDDSFAGAGAVYLFARVGTAWSQTAYVKASNTDPGDNFGTGVALWGSILAVGAPGEQSNATGIGGNQLDDSLAAAGAVYVFENAAGGLMQQLYVKASNTDADDLFGSALAADRDLLVAGALGEGSNATGVGGSEIDDSAPRAGASYLFE